jgi:hypothetical protein
VRRRGQHRGLPLARSLFLLVTYRSSCRQSRWKVLLSVGSTLGGDRIGVVRLGGQRSQMKIQIDLSKTKASGFSKVTDSRPSIQKSAGERNYGSQLEFRILSLLLLLKTDKRRRESPSRFIFVCCDNFLERFKRFPRLPKFSLSLQDIDFFPCW